jgi:hypothetical protein
MDAQSGGSSRRFFVGVPVNELDARSQRVARLSPRAANLSNRRKGFLSAFPRLAGVYNIADEVGILVREPASFRFGPTAQFDRFTRAGFA